MTLEIDYIPSFVAFFDILGFASLIQRSDDPEVASAIITELCQALKHAKEQIDSGWISQMGRETDRKCKQESWLA